MQNQKGSIYLLVGYFGSGKTTFIRNLLSNAQGEKYAVIQNEFAQGEMGIQQPLIVDETGIPFSQFLQLPNGCICCSSKNDLMAGVQYILSNTAVRKIMVQTNGLADPSKVLILTQQSIKQFWFDDNLNINGTLTSIIGVFSVEKFQKLSEEEIYKKQIIYCNKALITFVDKSNEESIISLENYIHTINPECQIFRNGQYQIKNILGGSNLFSTQNISKLPNTQLSHNHHGVESLFIQGMPSSNTRDEFEHLVGLLLWESNLQILRIKGVVCLADSQLAYELQGVEDTFELKISKSNKQKFQKSKILVIGYKLEKNKLKGILKIKE